MPDSLSNKTTFEVEVGWDILSGTGVTTALKIVHWPTTFPTRRYSFAVGKVIPKKNLPHSRRRSDPYNITSFNIIACNRSLLLILETTRNPS